MLQLFRRSSVVGAEHSRLHKSGVPLSSVSAEWCYYIESSKKLSQSDSQKLAWLLGETFDPEGLRPASHLEDATTVIEVGPRLNFETPWASTTRTICGAVGLTTITRIERARRFGFAQKLTAKERSAIEAAIHDRMTEMVYTKPLTSFATNLEPEPTKSVPVLEQGIAALRHANTEYGLAMDEHDLDMYMNLFVKRLRRNPTTVELFQLGQGNSEHSRHGFFKGKLVIDGKSANTNLMKIVKQPYIDNPNNSLIAFHDDSSAIKGGVIKTLVAETPGVTGPLAIEERTYHPTLTAETHNFPTGIAPRPGAETGTGGRIRDNQAVGRGGLVVASGVGYNVGNLHIPGYKQSWEDDGHTNPPNLASPLDILIEASNGASDYGNCFGEPLVLGHVQSFGLNTPGGYRSWYKPIMYTEGVGQLDDRHLEKGAPEKGMQVVQIGGPAYRIGMGGGAASSMMSGENAADLDFNAVQRGDAEMEQRVNRVIRVCVELGNDNPIISAHDLGAGGDSNALPEIIDPAGGRIDLRAIPVGDASLSVLEIWGNESQERNALLLWPQDVERFKTICQREGAPVAVVGEVTGNGQLVVFDSNDDSLPVDLPLEPILGDIPPKTISLTRDETKLAPLKLPASVSVEAALERVLRLLSVSSKNWLIRKVDRCVTGLIAQQQAVGPGHTPLSNYAVTAHSLFGATGTVISQGERPRIGLISSAAQGRMTVAEAVTNMMGAKINSLGDVRASANWMWAAKLPGEGAKLYDAAVSMSKTMSSLGMAVDGGKDSLSMATKEGDAYVKAPGQLVIAAYAYMDDVTSKVTPELKQAGNSLIFIDLSGGKARLGGSALAQAYQQLGDRTPDLEDAQLLHKTFDTIQQLIKNRAVVSLHDRSDGGLVTTLLEMSFAGNLGIDISLHDDHKALESLFCEELGLVAETASTESVTEALTSAGIPFQIIGTVTHASNVTIHHNDAVVVHKPMVDLRAAWEETSNQLEALQSNPVTATEEATTTRDLTKSPNWNLTYTPSLTKPNTTAPKVAVLREAGTNGDREMAGALTAAGFEAWDVTMHDLRDGKITLDQFRGVVFPGGFSFGDVLDSGKGWAGVIRFHQNLAKKFDTFYQRPDTFSLGVCNGAQLMALLGWVPSRGAPDAQQPRFIRNNSGRFECRFTSVEIQESPAIMLKDMAGSRLGVWVAHGEGRVHVPDDKLMSQILDQNLAPIRYIDPNDKPTTTYPFNPNGSPHGIASLCSADGRHLAMMPHPERLANQLWQWPWLPKEWKDLEASPWLKLFQNAYEWCSK